MPPEIAAEAVRFLSRRDLDRACAVSKWLDALIAQSCAVYPLRPVAEVALLPCWEEFTLDFRGDERNDSMESLAFAYLDEAVHIAGSVLRNSFVMTLQLGNYPFKTSLSPRHWNKLIEAIRLGAVQRLTFSSVDFTALDKDAFLVAVRCRGLELLSVVHSIVPSSFVTDDVLRSSVAKGVLSMWLCMNKSDSQHALSESAVLDYCFPADVALERQHRQLNLENCDVTDRFLINFFERLQSSSGRPSGELWLQGATKQRGLTAYAHYLAPSELPLQHTYRFPLNLDNNMHYEVVFSEHDSFMYMRFRRMDRSS